MTAGLARKSRMSRKSRNFRWDCRKGRNSPDAPYALTVPGVCREGRDDPDTPEGPRISRMPRMLRKFRRMAGKALEPRTTRAAAGFQAPEGQESLLPAIPARHPQTSRSFRRFPKTMLTGKPLPPCRNARPTGPGPLAPSPRRTEAPSPAEPSQALRHACLRPQASGPWTPGPLALWPPGPNHPPSQEKAPPALGLMPRQRPEPSGLPPRSPNGGGPAPRTATPIPESPRSGPWPA
jgi:hypothetical protein